MRRTFDRIPQQAMNPLTRWKFDRALDRAWRRKNARAVRARFRRVMNRRGLEGIRIVNRTGMPTDWEFYDNQGNRLDLRATQVIGKLTGEVNELPKARLELVGCEWDVKFPDCVMTKAQA